MSQLPKLPEQQELRLAKIVEMVCASFPFDERYDLPEIKTEHDLLSLTGVNNKNERFYLTPYIIAFCRALQKDSYINNEQ